MTELSVAQNEANQRLDKFLLKYLNKAGKATIYKLLRKKRIKLNGGRAQGSELLCAGDRISLYLAAETIGGFVAEKRSGQGAGRLAVVFEDAAVLVCEKAPGVLSQPEKQSDIDTVADRLLRYLSETGYYTPDTAHGFTPAVCNRLDRNTGGLILCGKTLPAVQALNAALRNRTIEKYYVTAVHGRLTEQLTLTGGIIKNAASNTVAVTPESSGGIRTEAEPIAAGADFSLLRVNLISGKTHQIRAHLAAAGYPVVGDKKYGDPRLDARLNAICPAKHQLLHAYAVVFKETSGFLRYLYDKKIVSPMPLWYNQFMSRMRNQGGAL